MPDRLRLDKWLFFARFFKSRALAADAAESGETLLNGRVVAKAAQAVRPGDALVFFTGPRRRHVRILALAESRRPAPEAQRLYEDLPPLV